MLRRKRKGRKVIQERERAREKERAHHAAEMLADSPLYTGCPCNNHSLRVG